MSFDKIILASYVCLIKEPIRAKSLGTFHVLFESKAATGCYAAPYGELFDLEKDPEELDNLAANGQTDIAKAYEGILRGMLDPEEMDEMAYRDQCDLVEKCGGREKVSSKGAIQASPVPGEKAEYMA